MQRKNKFILKMILNVMYISNRKEPSRIETGVR